MDEIGCFFSQVSHPVAQMIGVGLAPDEDVSMAALVAADVESMKRWLVMFRVYVHLRIVFELMLHVLDCVRCVCEPHVSSNIFGQGSKMLHQSGKL